MMGSQPWEIHTIPSNLTAELFPGLSYEEAVADQETLYEALKISTHDQAAVASGNERGTRHDQSFHVQSWDDSYLSENNDVDLQLALDEAMARSLQELEDGVDNVSISASHSGARNEENTSRNASRNASVNSSMNSFANASESSAAVGPDEDDALPEMTYEEMLSLGDAIGSERRGLSDYDISSLPSFKYKNGFFSKKGKAGECAICISEYQNKQYLTTLPCAHQYHRDCITRWLKENKTCPICQLEVDLSS